MKQASLLLSLQRQAGHKLHLSTFFTYKASFASGTSQTRHWQEPCLAAGTIVFEGEAKVLPNLPFLLRSRICSGMAAVHGLQPKQQRTPRLWLRTKLHGLLSWLSGSTFKWMARSVLIKTHTWGTLGMRKFCGILVDSYNLTLPNLIKQTNPTEVNISISKN